MTLSLERIPANIRRKESFQYYKEQIDRAAIRSARARAAAAKRKAAGQLVPEAKIAASTLPAAPTVSGRDVSATARCPRRNSDAIYRLRSLAAGYSQT